MMDVDQMARDERREVIFDAIQAGLFVTCLAIFILRGDIVISSLSAALLGGRIAKIVSRYRVIRWMHVVQTQDAVIEQLLRGTDELPPPRPTAPRGPKNGRI